MDHTIHGAEADKPAVRTVVHLHGAKTGPESDGYPEDWMVPGKSSLYYYPNQQDAAMLWYHDHALGINRLNVYAGLLGAFFIRDGVEEALNLPKGKCELPLILYDRLLTRDGQLLYPVSPDPQAPWVPEIFGNAILVNGKLFPYLEVEPRRYRFRVLNASNARFYNLSFIKPINKAAVNKDKDDCRFIKSERTRVYCRRRFHSRALKSRPGNAPILSSISASIWARRLVLKNGAFIVMQFRVSAAKEIDRNKFIASSIAAGAKDPGIAGRADTPVNARRVCQQGGQSGHVAAECLPLEDAGYGKAGAGID